MRRHHLWAWAPPLVLLAIIYRVSMEPAVPVASVYGLDKVLHAGEYGLLGLLLARAGRPALPLLALIALGSLAGAGDELIQSRVEGRDATHWDWMADTIGTILGVVWGDTLRQLRT